MGAGTLGTTEILLRSRACGLETSDLLGQRISGNGDLLAFAYNSDYHINGVGRDSPNHVQTEPCGPTISSCIDMREPEEAPNVKDGFLIQDGVIPEALGPVVQAIIESRTTMMLQFTRRSLDKFIAIVKSWVYGPYCATGSVGRTAVYLVMSHDENEGTLILEDDHTILQWSGNGGEERGKRLQSVLARTAASIGGTLVQVPQMTVHPLGGACMSYDGTGSGGAVNHLGQLFRGAGTDVHKGILCVDASIIPTSLGEQWQVQSCINLHLTSRRGQPIRNHHSSC